MISHIISFKADFTFWMIITFNLWEFMRFHILNGNKWYIKLYFLVLNNTKMRFFWLNDAQKRESLSFLSHKISRLAEIYNLAHACSELQKLWHYGKIALVYGEQLQLQHGWIFAGNEKCDEQVKSTLASCSCLIHEHLTRIKCLVATLLLSVLKCDWCYCNYLQEIKRLTYNKGVSLKR